MNSSKKRRLYSKFVDYISDHFRDRNISVEESPKESAVYMYVNLSNVEGGDRKFMDTVERFVAETRCRNYENLEGNGSYWEVKIPLDGKCKRKKSTQDAHRAVRAPDPVNAIVTLFAMFFTGVVAVVFTKRNEWSFLF